MKKAKLIPILSVLCALPAAARFPVIGYYASWSGGADDIPYGKLTHLNYSFAATGADAGLGGVDEGKLRDIVARAHQAGTKVGVAVGGWGADQAFIAMAATAAGRERFTANAVAFCDRLGLDGIDIDWEFPLPSNADAYESLLSKGAEDDLDTFVAVVVLIPCRCAHGLRPKYSEAVALGIELSGVRFCRI